MKKLLSLLLLSVVLIGCSEERVLNDELTNKGTEESQIMYYEGALFNGVGFDVYSDGQLKAEGNFKDGELDGLNKGWDEDGQLRKESNWKDGELDGLIKSWYEDGQLEEEGNFKDGELDGYKSWDENGQRTD